MEGPGKGGEQDSDSQPAGCCLSTHFSQESLETPVQQQGCLGWLTQGTGQGNGRDLSVKVASVRPRGGP